MQVLFDVHVANIVTSEELQLRPVIFDVARAAFSCCHGATGTRAQRVVDAHAMKLCWVDDPECERHLPPPGYLETPARLEALRRGSRRSGAMEGGAALEGRPASLDELCRAHTPAYLDRLEHTRGRSGFLDVDTFYSEHSFEAARRAAGAAVVLTDALLEGRFDYGLALIRPPGQHALPSAGMGSCLINHVAVAARHALANGARRVLILDWDVHHGNGTAEIFAEDPRALYVSLHQRGQFPGTGAAGDMGRGEGTGYTVNVPLSAGADDTVYLSAFRRLVLPIIEQYQPDMALVSAGYGAHRRDPLGGMRLETSAYAWMTHQLCQTLRQGPNHRFALIVEGGYDLEALEDCTSATLRALTCAPPVINETRMDERHSRELDSAIAIQRQFWRLE